MAHSEVERIISAAFHSVHPSLIRSAVHQLFNSLGDKVNEQRSVTPAERFFTDPNLPEIASIPSKADSSLVSALMSEHLKSACQRVYTSLDLQSSLRSDLRIKFPFNVSSHGLFLSICLSIDAIYSELDKLEGSGLAVGLDSLPSEIPITDPLDLDIFSGTLDQ